MAKGPAWTIWLGGLPSDCAKARTMVEFLSIIIGLPENFAEEFVGVDPSTEKSEGFSQVSSAEIPFSIQIRL